MARFHGSVGFLRTEEYDPVNHPGVYKEILEEKTYTGDVFQNSRRWDQNGNLNDDLVINNRISIVADGYMKDNLGIMRCVKWNGEYWKVTSFELQYPRIILTIGGLYHEPEQN